MRCKAIEIANALLEEGHEEGWQSALPLPRQSSGPSGAFAVIPELVTRAMKWRKGRERTEITDELAGGQSIRSCDATSLPDPATVRRDPSLRIFRCIYHLTSRGNSLQKVFFTNGDR